MSGAKYINLSYVSAVDKLYVDFFHLSIDWSRCIKPRLEREDMSYQTFFVLLHLAAIDLLIITFQMPAGLESQTQHRQSVDVFCHS